MEYLSQMAAWRYHARRLFPILRHELNTATYTLADLSGDLRLMMWEALSANEQQTLHSIFSFTAWCIGQEHRAFWVATTVKHHFYETLLDDHMYWMKVTPWISSGVYGACWLLWCTRWTPQERKRFEMTIGRNNIHAPTGYEIRRK